MSKKPEKIGKDLFFHIKNQTPPVDTSGIEATLNELNEKITTLENKLQNVGGGQNVGTSVAEISALMNDYINEDDFCTAASEKLQFGAQCKFEYAPHARMFFRHNPLKTLAPTINLGFWLSPLPSGITNLPATITLNGTTIFDGTLEITATTGRVAQITLPINRQQCPMQVFNVLEVSFNDDTNFATTFLDWIEVEITQSQNCIILNRSTDHEIYGLKRTNGSHNFYDSVYLGAGVTKAHGGDGLNVVNTSHYYGFAVKTINDIPIKWQQWVFNHTYTTSSGTYSYQIVYHTELLVTQNNRFYFFSTFMDESVLATTTYYLENVLYAKRSLHNGADNNISAVCVVYNDFNIDIYDTYSTYSYSSSTLNTYNFMFNNETYPNEFVDFIPVYDAFVGYRIGKQSPGYVLLHKSGNILFVPAINSPYFIKLGKGRQVHAFFGEDGNSVLITYQFNKSTIKKVLVRENAESEWQLSSEIETFLDIQELYLCGDITYGIQDYTIIKY